MKMRASIPVLIVLFTFAVVCTAYEGCQDRLKTSTCKYFIGIYRQKNVECCKWKWMKSNCAQSCKRCVPRCQTPISKYGCCWDKQTEAKGYYGEGCPDCKDRYSSYCWTRISRFSKLKACNEQGKKLCPKSCGVCTERAAAQAVPECESSFYGCCWDLTAASGLNGEGCRECQNLYGNLCRDYSDYCGADALRFASKKTIDFYRASCPVTCNKCQPGQKMLKSSLNALSVNDI